jgi:hypothetical protein
MAGFKAIYLIELSVFFNGSVSIVKHEKHGVLQGSSLGPLVFYIFTNDLPLALNEACVSMYADDSTTYASVTTANEVIETLNELQSVFGMGGQ